jgi:hypothetical protein
MAQTGYTPIQLYHSTTPGNVPDAANLQPGELALNTANMKLFAEDASGAVKMLASPGIPFSGSAKTSAYTLATTDVGQTIEIGSGGSITVPTSTFAAGDAVLIFNNNAGTSTITCSALTSYVGGTNTTRTSVTLAARGICNVLFVTPTLCVITGNVT